MEPTLGHGGGLCQHDWTSTNFLEAAPDSLPALPALPAAVETPQKAVRVGSWIVFSGKIKMDPQKWSFGSDDFWVIFRFQPLIFKGSNVSCHPFFGGSKLHAKRMVILRDFLKAIVHCLG